MSQILRNRNLTTRFQILVEIAANQPNILQRDVAKKLDVTPQAVSEHVRELVKEGLLVSDGRSKYRVTRKGVDWILKGLRELQGYCSLVTEAVTNITVCAAVADSDLSQGQVVGLRMRDGLLFATETAVGGARGIAVADAKRGEDVGITNIEGIVDLGQGKVTILKVPSIQKGGSKRVDPATLKSELDRSGLVGAIGIEALAALRRINVEPRYFYGVAEAAIEAAHCGLPVLIVCTDDDLAGLLTRLEEDGLDYEVIEGAANLYL